jgi:hypothetical protein
LPRHNGAPCSFGNTRPEGPLTGEAIQMLAQLGEDRGRKRHDPQPGPST